MRVSAPAGRNPRRKRANAGQSVRQRRHLFPARTRPHDFLQRRPRARIGHIAKDLLRVASTPTLHLARMRRRQVRADDGVSRRSNDSKFSVSTCRRIWRRMLAARSQAAEEPVYAMARAARVRFQHDVFAASAQSYPVAFCTWEIPHRSRDNRRCTESRRKGHRRHRVLLLVSGQNALFV